MSGSSSPEPKRAPGDGPSDCRSRADTGKRSTRRRLSEALAELSGEQISSWSRSIADRLAASPEWRQADVVLAFLSLPFEVRTEPIISRAIREGKGVAVPRMRGEELEFRSIEHLTHEWDVHSYGVREPASDRPLLDLADRFHRQLLVVVPGIAFDAAGRRLGRGRGFYDRFLREAGREVSTAGICFSLQLLASVPTDPHDIPVQIVVTEQAVHRPAER